MAIGADTTRSGTRTAGGVANAIRDLHPSYFAFVMATGIISTGTFTLGPLWLSRAMLVLASAGFVVLSAALVLRLVWYRSSVVADIAAPNQVFGFFTVVAAFDLLGVASMKLAIPRSPPCLPRWPPSSG